MKESFHSKNDKSIPFSFVIEGGSINGNGEIQHFCTRCCKMKCYRLCGYNFMDSPKHSDRNYSDILMGIINLDSVRR